MDMNIYFKHITEYQNPTFYHMHAVSLLCIPFSDQCHAQPLKCWVDNEIYNHFSIEYRNERTTEIVFKIKT